MIYLKFMINKITKNKIINALISILVLIVLYTGAVLSIEYIPLGNEDDQSCFLFTVDEVNETIHCVTIGELIPDVARPFVNGTIFVISSFLSYRIFKDREDSDYWKK